MAKSETQTNQMAEITSKLEKGVREVFESGSYQNYLKVFSKFHQYSINNIILMQMQFPTVSHVASFVDWKRKFKRHVKKNETGIKIIVPIKKKIIVSDDNKDDSDEDATIERTFFKIGTVFDISQTEGEELPALVHNLSFNSDILKDAINNIIKSFNIPITISDNIEQFGSANGYYVPSTKEIFIRSDLSDHQKIKTLIHELGHYESEEFFDLKETTREAKEIIAESVAFMTLELLKNETGINLSSDDYSFPYIAGWSKSQELSELKNTLSSIQKISTRLFNQIIPAFQIA